MDLLSEETAVDMESSVVLDIINQLIEKACISEKNEPVIATDIQSTEDNQSTIDDAIKQHLKPIDFETNEIEKNMLDKGDETEQSILKENAAGDHVTIDKNGEMVTNIEESIKLEDNQSNVIEVDDQPTKDKITSYAEVVAESSEKESAADAVIMTESAEMARSSECETQSKEETFDEYHTVILKESDDVKVTEIPVSPEIETQSMVAEEYDTPILQESQANDVKVTESAEIAVSTEMETQSMVAEEHGEPILQASDVKVELHAEIILSSEIETQSMVAEEYDTPMPQELQANDFKVTESAEIAVSTDMEIIVLSSEIETLSMADDVCVDKKTLNENDMKVLIAEETSKSTENQSEVVEIDTEAMIIEHCEIVSRSEMEFDEYDDSSESESDEIESSCLDHMHMTDPSEAVENGDNGKSTMENGDHQETNYENGQVFPKQSAVDIPKQLNTTVSRVETGVTDENISPPCGTKPKIPRMFTLRSDAIIASQSRAKNEAALKTTTKPSLGDDFYSNEVLRSKGYSLRVFSNSRETTQLTLVRAVNKFPNSEVVCTGLPSEMMENHLIPLFEKYGGKIFQMRLFLNKQGNQSVGKAYIIFSNQEDAERAVKTLNNREIQGRIIKVLRYTPNVRVFIKPIPLYATKGEIFNRFKCITGGLEKVILFNSPENEGKNRGFCYLEYENHQMAREAKKNLLNKNLFGKPIISDWPQKKSIEKLNDSDTLYISNLRPGLRSTDLRKYFDVYGEVSEIDKNGNFATVKFRNSEDAKRAASAVNKKFLGNENVEITFARLCKWAYQGPGSNKGGIIERYGPRATNDTSKKNSFGSNIKKYPKK